MSARFELGECRKCFLPCGNCPDQIRSELENARHNLANLEVCIQQRKELAEALVEERARANALEEEIRELRSPTPEGRRKD